MTSSSFFNCTRSRCLGVGSYGELFLGFRDRHNSVEVRVAVLALLLDLTSDGDLWVPVQFPAHILCVMPY